MKLARKKNLKIDRMKLQKKKEKVNIELNNQNRRDVSTKDFTFTEVFYFACKIVKLKYAACMDRLYKGLEKVFKTLKYITTIQQNIRNKAKIKRNPFFPHQD